MKLLISQFGQRVRCKKLVGAMLIVLLGRTETCGKKFHLFFGDHIGGGSVIGQQLHN